MNKKFLAVAIAASTFAAQAVAVELYNNDGTTFAVGGHVSVNLNGSEAGNTDVGTNSSRINFTATQDLGNGFTADARGEYALNFLDGGEESFTTRLGYIGVTHEEFGRAVAGTQWAPYYDVAGVADMPIAFASDHMYDNHGAFGTGRGDNMVSYRNGIDLAEAGAINFGLAWQGQASGEVLESDFDKTAVLPANQANEYAYDVKDRLQATVSYSLMGATLGYAYNSGDIKDGGVTETATSHLVSASYGTYGSGLYVAGVYASNELMNSLSATSSDGNVGFNYLLEESNAYEAIAAYALPNSLNFSINYEMVDGELIKGGTTTTVREELALQVEYNLTSNVVGYTGYQFDLNSKPVSGGPKVETDDMWVIGARVYL
ncbi:porin [Vibrio kyushuensis]|uniref:porin n=1 Tax=Vibrio kyushuensis TaxID=2910249 RepID=UPI003D0FFB37